MPDPPKPTDVARFKLGIVSRSSYQGGLFTFEVSCSAQPSTPSLQSRLRSYCSVSLLSAHLSAPEIWQCRPPCARTSTSASPSGSPRRSPPIPPSPSPPLSATPTSTLVKNFNTLYAPSSSSSSSSPSSASAAAAPDLAAAFASHRFFFSSPATPTPSSTPPLPPPPPPAPPEGSSASAPLVDDSVAVPTYSPDPYADFRRSMQEMVEARQLFDVKSDWDLLHELLLCYLALNPKSTHKFIVGAFADLLVSLMSRPRQRGDRAAGGGAADEEFSPRGNGCKIFRRCIN
ncbi:transcription repressor OFP16-like [Eucalyptus grandis]|uniref:transcription repressor OFP16-like n=1 Tax=Eucalyptus grandis TaxID=71139 RepID=UPI00192EAB59|nr:transcription repressor OFP16-like [Eucalyptus grandis]